MKNQKRVLYCGPEDSLFKKLSRSAPDLIWEARQINFSSSPQKVARQSKASVLLLKVKTEFVLKHQEWLSKNNASVPVIIVCQNGNMEMAIQAIQYGAFDYFSTTQSSDVIIDKIRQALEGATTQSSKRNPDVKNQVLLGNHPSILQVNQQAEAMAQDHNPVLITGEAGTGKEHLAYGMYRLAGKKSAPFLRFDCRTLLEVSKYDGQAVPQLIHSQLRTLPKRTSAAYLFLSHCEYLPSDQLSEVAQKTPAFLKLFASYQESRPTIFLKKIEEPMPSIRIPSLRQRKEDIPIIVDHFARKVALKKKVRNKTISDGALNRMEQYAWPGNIQELSNVVERMMLLEPSNVLTESSWYLSQGYNLSINPEGANQFSALLDELLQSTEEHWKKGKLYEEFMGKMEKMLVELVLPQVDFNQAIAAKILGISRNTLRERLKEGQASPSFLRALFRS